jgi:hypothetical protein
LAKSNKSRKEVKATKKHKTAIAEALGISRDAVEINIRY